MLRPVYPWSHASSPLSPQEFHVLLALADKECYAYQLKGQVMKDSLGSVNIADGTLYPLLSRLHGIGFVDMTGRKAAGKSGKTRLHYALSAEGRLRLIEEPQRLSHVMKLSENRGLLDEIGPVDMAKLLLDMQKAEN